MFSMFKTQEFGYSPRYICFCGTHGAEDAAAAQQSAFTNQMLSQATSVFGADNSVWHAMNNAYSQLLAAGPSQFGFSAAQTAALNASAITQGANQSRDILASIGGKQAGAGGGNAPNSSGIGVNQKAGIEEAIAGQTAGELNKIQLAGWQTGRENWTAAGEGLSKSTSPFSNLSGVDSAAQAGLKANMANAQAADAASNWWVKDANAVAGAGLSLASGGLASGLGNMSADSSFLENVGNVVNGMGGNTTPGPGAPPASTPPDLSSFVPGGSNG